MGFFEKLFGRGLKKRVELVLSPEELEGLLQEKTMVVSGELEKVVFSRLSEIKHLLNEVSASVGALGEKEVSLDGNTRLRKVVRTSKEDLVIQLNSLLKKLSVPKTNDLSKIMNYSFESSVILGGSLVSARKNLAYAQTILGSEIKELGKSVNELDTAFLELKKCFDESSLQKTNSINSGVQDFSKRLLEKKSLEESFLAKQKELQELKDKKTQILGQIAGLKNSEEMKQLFVLEKEMASLGEKKSALKSRFVSLLGEVEKPLHRFLKLAESGNYIVLREEQGLLSLYMADPFLAIKKDTKGTVLKKLLIEVEKLVLDSKIVLKEKEKGKKIAALQKLIAFDFFSEIFWELNSIDSKIIETEKKILGVELSRRISELELELAFLDRGISEKNDFLAAFSSKIAQKEMQLVSFKASIEQSFLEEFGEKIVIRF